MMNIQWNRRNSNQTGMARRALGAAALLSVALLAGGTSVWAAPAHTHEAHETPAGTQEIVGATGVVREVDPVGQRITLAHEPIAELNWPAMTMDFEVQAGVALDELDIGQRIRFSLHEQQDGSWVIAGIRSVGGDQAQAGHEGRTVTVYKLANCGCCTKWASHMQKHGFDVAVVEVDSTESIRREMGVPSGLDSCHTAVVGDYFVEGHVPADLVQRLLAEQPANAAGLTVPGMPHGSPGMESPHAVEYEVLLVDEYGERSVYATRVGKRD